MAERRDWTREEVEATVVDYFSMLAKEIRGEHLVKAEHRRRLLPALDDRSEGAIEFKHRNITAILNELGLPGIDGYKPATNYQELLFEVVEARLPQEAALLALVRREVDQPAVIPSMDDILSRLVARPPSGGDEPRYRTGRERRWVHGNRPNYLLREARNSSLGSAGERFVLNFEQARLIKEGKERLAAQVEQVSQTRGDHEGFDILSFESDGRERLIEVKTTAFGSLTPFFVSQNQVKTSHQHRDQFQVYRVFRFRRDPRLFAVPGAIGENCDLEAREFVARWL